MKVNKNEVLQWSYVCMISLTLYYVSSIVMPFIIGVILSYISMPGAKFLHNKCKLSLSIAAAIMVTLMYALIVWSIYYLVPIFYHQLISVIEILAKIKLDDITKLINYDGMMNFLEETHTVKIFEEMRLSATQKLPQYLSAVSDHMLHSTGIVLVILLNIIFSPFIAFYIIKDHRKIISNINEAPIKIKQLIFYLIDIAERFFRSQFTVILFFSIYYCLTFSLIKIKSAIFLGIMCGIMAIIPYVGTVISFIICFVITFIQYNFELQIWIMIISFSLGHVLDTLWVYPQLVGNKLGLHPLMTIFSLLASAAIFGAVGVIIALPMALIIQDLTKMIFIPIRCVPHSQ